jgi:hypothetical protein
MHARERSAVGNGKVAWRRVHMHCNRCSSFLYGDTCVSYLLPYLTLEIFVGIPMTRVME